MSVQGIDQVLGEMRGVSALAGGRAPEPVVSTPPSGRYPLVVGAKSGGIHVRQIVCPNLLRQKRVFRT